MVDADFRALQPPLELRIIFAEIMEQVGHESQPFKTERRGECGRQAAV
jgi:hypothetical protein